MPKIDTVLPAYWVEPRSLSAVVGPAILFPTGRYGETFLIGAGASPSVMFLSGEHRGHFFLQEGADSWHGIAVEGVRIEVDLTSVYSRGEQDHPVGAAVRVGQGWSIHGMVKDRGFREKRNMEFSAGLPAIAEENVTGFTRWFAVVGEGTEKKIILSHNASPSTDEDEEE